MEGLGAFDEDSNHDSMIEDKKLPPRTGIEPSIIPAWEEITKHWKLLQENFPYLVLIK